MQGVAIAQVTKNCFMIVVIVVLFSDIFMYLLLLNAISQSMS